MTTLRPQLEAYCIQKYLDAPVEVGVTSYRLGFTDCLNLLMPIVEGLNKSSDWMAAACQSIYDDAVSNDGRPMYKSVLDEGRKEIKQALTELQSKLKGGA